ncbi:MAG: hypothetical protein K2L42_06175 [Clostridia bacterium]|nr:hypothetical protein [Clostridia bacterium]
MKDNYTFDERGSRRSDSRTVRIILSVLGAVIFAVIVFFAGFLTSRLTLTQEQKSLGWILDTIEKNYLFYDDFDRNGVSYYSIDGKLDRYSEYYTREEYEALQADNAGSKSGIGISYSFVEGKGVLINTVVGNSPANEAEIRAGDFIVSGKKDGKEFVFSSRDDFTAFAGGCKTGETFTLVNSEGYEYKPLAKAEYKASYAYMATADTAWEFRSSANGGLSLQENRSKAKSCLPEGTAYINASQFYGTLADEFGVLIKKFNAESCTSLILDLRNNGGGYVSVMCDMAGYFVSSVQSGASVAMTAEYRSGKKEVYYCERHSGDMLVPKGTEVYVLANSGTASASEALIGVLVSYGILDYENIFVSDYSQEYLEWAGEGAKTAQTYGKGIMQTTFRNNLTGEALKLTTARILWPNGKCIHDVALSKKDGCTEVPAAWSVTADDKELCDVVEIIKQK